MVQKSLDPDLVDALAAASSHGHYYPPVELVAAVVRAAEHLGPIELISQFELKQPEFPTRWMEFQQWTYLKASGDVLLVVPPPDIPVGPLVDQMRKACDDGARACCMILPLAEVRTEMSNIVRGGGTLGISDETHRWHLLREGTRRRDYAALVLVTESHHEDTEMRAGLDKKFWFAEHRNTVRGR